MWGSLSRLPTGWKAGQLLTGWKACPTGQPLDVGQPFQAADRLESRAAFDRLESLSHDRLESRGSRNVSNIEVKATRDE
jgi:hypothetical protein